MSDTDPASAKVYSMNGEHLTHAGKPVVESVVSHLEDLLERARSGHLRALAYAIVEADGGGRFGVAGIYPRDIMIGELEIAKQWIITQLFEDIGIIDTDRRPDPPAA